MAKNLKFSRYLRKSKYTYSNRKLYSAKITTAAYSEDLRKIFVKVLIDLNK